MIWHLENETVRHHRHRVVMMKCGDYKLFKDIDGLLEAYEQGQRPTMVVARCQIPTPSRSRLWFKNWDTQGGDYGTRTGLLLIEGLHRDGCVVPAVLLVKSNQLDIQKRVARLEHVTVVQTQYRQLEDGPATQVTDNGESALRTILSTLTGRTL